MKNLIIFCFTLLFTHSFVSADYCAYIGKSSSWVYKNISSDTTCAEPKVTYVADHTIYLISWQKKTLLNISYVAEFNTKYDHCKKVTISMPSENFNLLVTSLEIEYKGLDVKNFNNTWLIDGGCLIKAQDFNGYKATLTYEML